MSTRSTTHFYDDREAFENKEPTAIIYRHHDGYPEGAGQDILKFIEEVKEQCAGTMYGTRFNDAAYLSAKYLTFLVLTGYGWDQTQPLNFGGVGVLNDDPMDIEYRYNVICAGDWTGENEPEIFMHDLWDRLELGKEHEHLIEDAIALAEKAEV